MSSCAAYLQKPLRQTLSPSRARNSSKAGPASSLLYISSSDLWPALQYRTPTLCFRQSWGKSRECPLRAGWVPSPRVTFGKRVWERTGPSWATNKMGGQAGKPSTPSGLPAACLLLARPASAAAQRLGEHSGPGAGSVCSAQGRHAPARPSGGCHGQCRAWWWWALHLLGWHHGGWSTAGPRKRGRNDTRPTPGLTQIPPLLAQQSGGLPMGGPHLAKKPLPQVRLVPGASGPQPLHRG